MKKRKTLLLTLATVGLLSLAACGENQEETKYTFNSYVSVSPSNWNELTYQDNNDTEILSYCVSNLFEFDYKFDANGEIVDGSYEVKYSAATKLEDVSADYAGKYGLPEDAEAGDSRAFKITLRDDLAWDDGTKITAKDFVYTMKEQLNPLFKNYRADSYYVGSTVIHNARNYVYQGSYALTDFFDSIPSDVSGYPALDSTAFTRDSDGYILYNGEAVYLDINDGGNWGAALTDYVSESSLKSLFPEVDDNGQIRVGDSALASIQYVIAVLHGYESVEAYAAAVGEYAYVECEEMFKLNRKFAVMDFSDVGIFVGSSENELVLVLDKALNLINEDGSLNYRAAYNMSSLPLVKEDIYESCKIAPTTSDGLWTTNYNTSLATSASWGPYKLTGFEQDQSFTLTKNEKWFGFQSSCDLYKDMYQTDVIYNRVIPEWNTAFLAFQKGELDSVGIDASVASTYKGSEQAIFTPSDFVGSLQLQSSKDALKARESAGVNKTLLSYEKFRKALSLSIDRADLTNECTTSSLPGFGLFNSMHYSDVEHGIAYRTTDSAKETLCDVYGVDVSQYDNLTEAEESITGYNVSLARQYLNEAIEEAKAAGDYKTGDKVVLDMGTGSISESVTRMKNNLLKHWTNLVSGTELEGKFEVTLSDKGSAWANDFRSGSYDLCLGGWTGAAWDPGYFLLAYLDPNYMYSSAWDTSKAMLTFQLSDHTIDPEEDTHSLLEWYDVLNGEWGSGRISEDLRAELIAAIEKEILNVCYTVPIYNSYSASLISYKIEYKSRTYNTFMGYGGLKYMKYNYSDSEWTKYVADQGGTIDYSKGN